MNLMINPTLTLTIAADHRQALYTAADRRRLRRQLRASSRTGQPVAAAAVGSTARHFLTVAPLSPVAERPATMSTPRELEHASARVA